MKTQVLILAVLLTSIGGRSACALIYLGEGSLESMLVRCPLVIIATATQTDAENDRATLDVQKSLKGDAKGEITVKGFLLHVNAREKKPRFARNDRVVLFMGKDEKTGTMTIIKSQVLADEKESKIMEGCITEVMPFAQTLA